MVVIVRGVARGLKIPPSLAVGAFTPILLAVGDMCLSGDITCDRR